PRSMRVTSMRGVSPMRSRTDAMVVYSTARARDHRPCAHKRDRASDPIDVCFGPLCGLRSDISRGPRSANRVLTPCRKFAQLLDHVVCLAAQLREGKARRRGGEDRAAIASML